MDYWVIFNKVKKILCESFDVDESKITVETDLFGDLDADSLDLVDLVSSIEYEFGIETYDKVVEEIRNVDDVVRSVEKLINFME